MRSRNRMNIPARQSSSQVLQPKRAAHDEAHELPPPLIATQLQTARRGHSLSTVGVAGGAPPVQRSAAPGQAAPASASQFSHAGAGGAEAAQAGPALEAAPNRTGLPDALKAGAEALSNVSLDSVRVQYNSSRPAELGALAYAQGPDIHIGPGQEQHLPHETWHVVQQMQGRVQPTVQAKGVDINDDAGLEREADVMGAQAFQVGHSVSTPPAPSLQRAPRAQPVQRMQGEGAKWIVFGADGKSREAIDSAIEVGYRQFDCAESYRNTPEVAEAIRSKSDTVPRSEFKVTYKFDPSSEDQESISRSLQRVIDMFGGYIDTVLIHNLDMQRKSAIQAAWLVLSGLQKEKKAHKIGLGNIGEQHAEFLGDLGKSAGIDVIENSMSSVLSSESLQRLIEQTGAQLHYYDVMRTAEDMGINSEEGLKLLISRMSTMGTAKDNEAGALPILSSANSVRQKGNLETYGGNPDDFELNYDLFGNVDSWLKNNRFCQNNDAAYQTPDHLSDILGYIYNKNQEARENIAERYGNDYSSQHIRTWLRDEGISDGDLERFKIPAREGLNKRFLGKSLGSVLEALLGSKNCDHKWAIQLLGILINPVDMWPIIRMVADEITK